MNETIHDAVKVVMESVQTFNKMLDSVDAMLDMVLLRLENEREGKS